MLRHLSAAIVVAALSLTAVACGRQPAPPPPATSWTPEATDTVATALMDSLLRDAWSSQWKATNQGRVPAIEVAAIEDRSDDRVPVDALARAFAARIAAGDAERVVLAGATAPASVRLSGHVTLLGVSVENGQKIRRFGIDLLLHDIATGNQIVSWPGSNVHSLVDPRP